MRLEIHSDERGVLLRELEECQETMSEIYRERGGEWDPYDPRHDDGFARLIRAQDDLHGAAPWHLEAPRRDLELLLTALRKGASHALELRGEPPPVAWLQSRNATDPEGTDRHLDIMATCDTLLDRLRTNDSE